MPDIPLAGVQVYVDIPLGPMIGLRLYPPPQQVVDLLYTPPKHTYCR